MKQRLVFIAEGPTEKALLHHLGIEGKKETINLAQTESRKFERYFGNLPKPNMSEIYLLIDTDLILNFPHCLKNIEENIKLLTKHGYKIFVLQQHRDLEDELAYACGFQNINKLLGKVNCTTKNELKGKVIKNPSCVTSINSFEKSKLWNRNLIEELKHCVTKEMKKSFDDLKAK